MLARNIPAEPVCHLLGICNGAQLEQLNEVTTNGTSVPNLGSLMVPQPPRTSILLPGDGPRQSMLQYQLNDYNSLVDEISQDQGESIFTFLARYKLIKNQRHCPEPNCASLMTFTRDSSHLNDGFKVNSRIPYFPKTARVEFNVSICL